MPPTSDFGDGVRPGRDRDGRRVEQVASSRARVLGASRDGGKSSSSPRGHGGPGRVVDACRSGPGWASRGPLSRLGRLSDGVTETTRRDQRSRRMTQRVTTTAALWGEVARSGASTAKAAGRTVSQARTADPHAYRPARPSGRPVKETSWRLSTPSETAPRRGSAAAASFLDWADVGLVAAARGAGPDLQAALALARGLGPVSADPGQKFWTVLQVLGSLGAGDLTVARVIEPHLDALAILAQAAAPWRRPRGDAPPRQHLGGVCAHAPGSRTCWRPSPTRVDPGRDHLLARRVVTTPVSSRPPRDRRRAARPPPRASTLRQPVSRCSPVPSRSAHGRPATREPPVYSSRGFAWGGSGWPPSGRCGRSVGPTVSTGPRREPDRHASRTAAAPRARLG